MNLSVRIAFLTCVTALLATGPAWPQIDMRLDMRAPEARTDPLPDHRRDNYGSDYGWNSDCYRYNSGGFCARSAFPLYGPWTGIPCPPGFRGVTPLYRGRSYYCP